MSSYKIHDFYSHKTEGVTINNNLNVTGTSQLETLNVSGNLDVVGNISLNGSNIVNSDGSMEVTGTAQLNALNVTGSVGIGTNNPGSALQIGEIANQNNLTVHGDIFLDKVENDDKFEITNNGNVNTSLRYLQIVDNDNISNFSGINLTRTGVGIGNTSPTAPLSFENVVANKKIALYDTFNDNNKFYGFGVNGAILRYQVDQTLSDHVFYAATSSTTSNELFRIQGNGTIYVPGKIGVRTTPNSTVDIAIGDNDTGFKQQGDGELAVFTNGGERVRFDNNGYVGIGTNNPLTTLHTKAKFTNSGGSLGNYNQANIIMEGSANTNKWAMSVSSSGVSALIFTLNQTQRGYFEPSVDVGQIDFTGQHRARFSEDNIEKLNNINDYVGLIVCSTGNYINPIDINEALPYVELSTTSKDKRVFGVISNGEDTNSNQREYKQGTFVSVVDIEENDHRAIINSVGEGAMWVCDENGPIENGDYITTSNNAGYGMKQNEEYLAKYTVAKITCDEDFSDMTNGRILPNGVKCKFVGVSYHCG